MTHHHIIGWTVDSTEKWRAVCACGWCTSPAADETTAIQAHRSHAEAGA